MSVSCVPLAEVCEINPATDYKFVADERCTFVPMEAVDDVSASITSASARPFREIQKGYTAFAENDVLIAKITPCMENGKCAIARRLYSGVGFGSTEFHVLRASKYVLPQWLLYFWRLPETRRLAERSMTGSAGQKRVPASFLEALKIPLPPLPEQQRVAELLEQADRLCRTRRYALELSDTFLPAAFLELFGEPRMNPRGFSRKPIDAVCERIIDYRGRTPEYSDAGIAHVTAACIKEREIKWRETKRVSEQTFAIYMTRGMPRFGDVLLTTEAPLGETAVVRTRDRFSLAQRIILLRPAACLMSDYLCYLVGHPRFQPELVRFATGTTVKGISSENLRAIPISVPPLGLQKRFADLVTHSERLRAGQREALRQAEHLFQSLLHQTFGESH